MVKFPKILWKSLKIPAQLLYKLGLGPVMGQFVLLLTTIGRKSGKRRVTPLQYEEVKGDFYVASVRGSKADWIRNIQANPSVEVKVKTMNLHGQAKTITDPIQIADFLELRLERRPQMVGRIMRAAGLPSNPSRSQLENYAANRVMVIIHPIKNNFLQKR